MDFEKLNKANALKGKIEEQENILKVLDKLEEKERVFITDYNNGSVVLPKDLKTVIFHFMKEHHKNVLSEYKKEFDEL